MALPSSASPFLSSTQNKAYFTSSRKPLHRFVTRSTLSDDLFLAAKHAVRLFLVFPFQDFAKDQNFKAFGFCLSVKSRLFLVCPFLGIC